MRKLLAITAVALLGFTGAAHASVLDVTLGPSLTFGLGGGSLSPNVDLQSLGGGLSLSLSNAQIVAPPSSQANVFASPTGTIFANSYLSVFGINTPPNFSGTAGTGTFNLGTTQNVFSFTWGTIDHYNSLVIKDAANNTFTITGTDILNHIAGSVDGTTQSDVSFFDPLAKITSVELTTTDNSFEAANFGTSETPLPGALLMFGTALLGFGYFARRQLKARTA